MSKNLLEVLEEIIHEYDLAYEPFHSEAVYRAIEILKDTRSNLIWTEEVALKRMKKHGRD